MPTWSLRASTRTHNSFEILTADDDECDQEHEIFNNIPGVNDVEWPHLTIDNHMVHRERAKEAQ